MIGNPEDSMIKHSKSAPAFPSRVSKDSLLDDSDALSCTMTESTEEDLAFEDDTPGSSSFSKTRTPSPSGSGFAIGSLASSRSESPCDSNQDFTLDMDPQGTEHPLDFDPAGSMSPKEVRKLKASMSIPVGPLQQPTDCNFDLRYQGLGYVSPLGGSTPSSKSSNGPSVPSLSPERGPSPRKRKANMYALNANPRALLTGNTSMPLIALAKNSDVMLEYGSKTSKSHPHLNLNIGLRIPEDKVAALFSPSSAPTPQIESPFSSLSMNSGRHKLDHGLGSGCSPLSPGSSFGRRSVDESSLWRRRVGLAGLQGRQASMDELRRRRESFAGFSPHHHVSMGSIQHISSCGGSGTNEPSNLLRLRSSLLGQSAPSLSNSSKELNIVRRGARGPSQRKGIMSTTSPTLPRCHSPLGQSSPMESPRNMSPLQHFAFAPSKKGDGRRWSVASLPSSGYGTTPGSSNVSSQCSSQERLHQIGGGAMSGVGGSSLPGEGLPGGGASATNSPAVDCIRFAHQRHFSSGDSNPSLEDEGRRSPMTRPRSRSLSSPIRSPVIDNEIILMNTLYKERFPKATQQMEERLQHFIEDHHNLEEQGPDIAQDAVAIARFVHHQVIEMAKDCLQKSKEKLITSRYFYELSENLEKLLTETRDKSSEAAAHLTWLIKKLLLIVSRPARLLECLEFDPEEFYHLLEQAEGQARTSQGIKTDIPQYIITKLGLNRDPLADFSDDLAGDADTEDSCLNSSGSFLNASSDSGGSTTCKFSSPPGESPMQNSTNSMSTASSSTIMPKEEDYERIKLISNGAYGAVDLVRHRHTKERFAMKKISKNNLMLRNQVEQVFNERDIMSFTDNPFVVSMICSFETKRHLCLVMEYVEGGDCANLLKNMGPFPPDMARFYFAETVLAVEYLHSYGIVHRDLKPDNLLITAFGHIKLTDFGLSKMGLMSLATNLYEGYIDKETRQFSDKQVFGTPEYIAPEVILRQGYGKPVDWWAMGIILYEFLIGCVPFFGETPEELFAHTVNDDIEWPEEDDFPVPDDGKNLITALLQHSPIDRLGTVGGAVEVKEHLFFFTIDWNSLLRHKAEFVPQLDDDEDTSYFDTRLDRYNHEPEEDSEGGETESLGGSGAFSSFSSFVSPRYHQKISSSLSTDSSQHDNSAQDVPNRSSVKRTSNREPEGDATDDLEGGRGSVSRGDSGHSDQSESSRSTLESSMNTPDADTHEASHTHDSSQNRFDGQPQSTVLHSTPDSSQTESEDVSPQIQRRRRLHSHTRDTIPRFSISGEEDCLGVDGALRELSPVDEKPGTSSRIPLPRMSIPLASTGAKHRSRTVIKSASASGLSLVIPDDLPLQPVQSPGGGSSTASSRDTSPSREVSPLTNSLKPPIIVRRGPQGYGFTLRAIRVYFGNSDFYTVHHLMMDIDQKGPAFESGLRPGDLITHINGEPIQGMLHMQVLTLLMSSNDHVTLRAVPLDQTSIRPGGRKRHPQTAKMAKRVPGKGRKKGRDGAVEKKKRTSLIRKISSKMVSSEMQQLAAVGSPTVLTPSRSFYSLSRSVSSQDATAASLCCKSPHSPPAPPSRLFSQSENSSSPVNSSGSSSPSSSVPNSPAASSTLHQRPSSLHVINVKVVRGKNRRKSVGHVPVSPLARTPSPSPIPTSPTRSPSPLVPHHHHHHHHNIHHHHYPGSSLTTQSYSPGSSLTPVNTKKCLNRPKSAEPGSPLLRRALSPDRLHPRSAENKTHPTISPLATPSKLGSTPPRVTITSQPTATQRYSTSGVCMQSSLPASTLEEAPEELDSPDRVDKSLVSSLEASSGSDNSISQSTSDKLKSTSQSESSCSESASSVSHHRSFSLDGTKPLPPNLSDPILERCCLSSSGQNLKSAVASSSADTKEKTGGSRTTTSYAKVAVKNNKEKSQSETRNEGTNGCTSSGPVLESDGSLDDESKKDFKRSAQEKRELFKSAKDKDAPS